MKPLTIHLLALAVASISTLNCSKNSDATFCSKDRPIADTAHNRAGTIYYNTVYGRWAIHIDSNYNRIDDSFHGFSCGIPLQFRTKDLRITFTGILKRLNNDEIRPGMPAASNIFYIDLTNISR